MYLRSFIHGEGRFARTGSNTVYHIVRNLKSPVNVDTVNEYRKLFVNSDIV